MSRKCNVRSSPKSHPQSRALLLTTICQKGSSGSLKHITRISNCSEARGPTTAPWFCGYQFLTHPCTTAEASHPLMLCWHSPWDTADIKQPGGEGREGFWHVCFQPDQCSNLFCPRATLMWAPAERRWQPKCQRRAGCSQPGLGFSAYLQPLWHRQSQQERARRCGCWIKQTFLAPLSKSCCKSQPGQRPPH